MCISIKNKSNRIVFIDEIRGFCIILMVLYHYAYNVFQIYGIEFLNSAFLSFLRDFFAGIFILISGISCNFSKNNFVRGLKCFGLGLLITLFTHVFISEQIIIFGILHMLGLAMIVYSLVNRYLNRLNKKMLMVLFFVLFIITGNVVNGYIGIFTLIFFYIPDVLYSCKFLFPLGIVSNNFYSADYFPMLPWLFLFLFGAVLGSLRDVGKFPKFMYKRRCKAFAFIGRITIWIYLGHQPIFYLFLYIFKKFNLFV